MSKASAAFSFSSESDFTTPFESALPVLPESDSELSPSSDTLLK